ncbi:MAG: hypothetical protein HQM16_12840 [Deltaproteobacteria bacterium]|nr:hypothetical protein [Deltaproteobacteria bacterium]
MGLSIAKDANRYAVVTKVQEASAAYGLLTPFETEIMAIDGVSTRDMTEGEVIMALRGAKDTPATLTIKQVGENDSEKREIIVHRTWAPIYLTQS